MHFFTISMRQKFGRSLTEHYGSGMFRILQSSYLKELFEILTGTGGSILRWLARMLLTRGLISSLATVRRPEFLATQTSPQCLLFPHKMAVGFPEWVFQTRIRQSHNVFYQSNLRNHTLTLLPYSTSSRDQSWQCRRGQQKGTNTRR